MPFVPRALCLVALAAVGCLEKPISDDCPAGSVAQGKECVRTSPGGAAGSAGAAGAAAGAAGGGASGAAAGGSTSVGCSCPSDRPFCDAQGECVQCVSAAQCPKPASECVTALCTNGTCATLPAKQGAPVTKQTAGDCTRIQCNGLGGEEAVADASDPPPDDGAPCTSEACDGMAPVHPFKNDGEACAGGTCNGKGACVECAPGQKRCFENAPQACSADGKWVGDAKCAAPVPACSAGACVGVKEVSVGGRSSCALLTDGTVRCWGDNWQGGLGSADPGVPVLRPTPMKGVTDATHVTTSAGSTCVTFATGAVRCWGKNDWGQLGDGTQVPSLTGTLVKGLSTTGAVAMSGVHSCATTTTGLLCWGRGLSGELGAGDTTSHPSPIAVMAPPALGVAVGSKGYPLGLIPDAGHGCALFPDATLRCWGENKDGQLGIGTGAPASTPQTVMSVEPGARLAVGSGFACIATGGGAKCWGANEFGQLGLGTMGASSGVPQAPMGQDKGVLSIAAAAESACALRDGGTSVCWGRNLGGCLATGATDDVLPPTPTVLPPVTSIGLGGGHGCALTPGSQVLCWGWNMDGQLGDGTQVDRTTPAEVVW